MFQREGAAGRAELELHEARVRRVELQRVGTVQHEAGAVAVDAGPTEQGPVTWQQGPRIWLRNPDGPLQFTPAEFRVSSSF